MNNRIQPLGSSPVFQANPDISKPYNAWTIDKARLTILNNQDNLQF